MRGADLIFVFFVSLAIDGRDRHLLFAFWACSHIFLEDVVPALELADILESTLWAGYGCGDFVGLEDYSRRPSPCLGQHVG